MIIKKKILDYLNKFKPGVKFYDNRFDYTYLVIGKLLIDCDDNFFTIYVKSINIDRETTIYYPIYESNLMNKRKYVQETIVIL